MPKILTWLKYRKNKLSESKKKESEKGAESPYDIFQNLKVVRKDDSKSAEWKSTGYENTGFLEHKKEFIKWKKIEIFALAFEGLILLYILLFFLGIVPLF